MQFQKENQNFIKNYEHESNPEKNISDSLKTTLLFIGHHWTAVEVFQLLNLDIKGEYSLSDLKAKECKKFS